MILDTPSEAAPVLGPPHPPTLDLDPTTDLHDENTSDLATTDFEPDDGEPQAALEAPLEPARVSPAESPKESLIESHITLEPHRITNAALAQVRRQPMGLAPGAILSDRYLIEALIGVGGVSMVYRARDMQSSDGAAPNRQVAVKIPRAELHDVERARMRLTHEYQHARGLSHPNIVRVLELEVDAQPGYMTMELIEGKLLSALLHDMGKPLPSALALRILDGCGQALSHAHAHSIVHGDFKPGNVLITRDQRVKVFDFGAAAAPRTTESRIAAGTPAYASPEVLSGSAPEPRDDVFSFACVAYELLTGKHPFDRRSSLQAREEGCLPPRAWSLTATQWLMLLSALSWTREQRPPDIVTLTQALLAAAPTEPSAPEPPRVVEHRPLASELADEMMPPQRSWGFFVFLACAFIVTFIATQRKNERDDAEIAAPATSVPAPTALSAPPGLMAAPVSAGSHSSAPLSGPEAPSPSAPTNGNAPAPAPEAATSRAPARERSSSAAAGRRSEITFDPDDIVTSEGSVAAVFLIKRSQPLTGRARVQWRATSGTADAGIDFASDAAGSVEFAVGQAQRAIYVPLRNDLLAEEDETFTVQLHSPGGARIGKANTVTATIRDDD
jgi:serine/threonine protein kinase